MIIARKKIGLVVGAFDLFHAGHVIMLKECKEVCDYLIVGIQTDPTLDRPKKKNKPVQSIIERQIQVGGCRYVNQVVVYETEDDLVEILKSFDIDVRILGAEYEKNPELITGREVCAKRKIKLYFNKRDHDFSTSELRERVKKQ